VHDSYRNIRIQISSRTLIYPIRMVRTTIWMHYIAPTLSGINLGNE